MIEVLGMNDSKKPVLTPNERADILNLINRTFDENDIQLQAIGYEDDGRFFSIFTQRPFGYEEEE